MSNQEPPSESDPKAVGSVAAAGGAAQDRGALARTAKRLLDEQLRAKIVYYEPDQATNAELDQITSRVVSELRTLQSAGLSEAADEPPEVIENELVRNMTEQLSKMLSARREHFLRHKIQLIQRRITALFFSSEVGVTESVDLTDKRFEHPDEALHAALKRHERAIADELASFQLTDRRILDQAVERLQAFQRQLLSEFLARSRPELEALLAAFRDVLLVFLVRDFRGSLPEFSKDVISRSRVAHMGSLTYKIPEDAFGSFRPIFEERFIESLLKAVQGPLAERMKKEHAFRQATIKFAANPRVYAEIGSVVCNAFYDYLHGEGFLDLPVHWQRHVQQEATPT